MNDLTIISIKKVIEILTPEGERGPSERWVYNHAEDLGARKIGGRLIWTEQGVRNAIKGGEDLPRNSEEKRGPVHQKVQDKSRGKKVGGSKKRRVVPIAEADPYGLIENVH
jgi:hypothetical protein